MTFLISNKIFKRPDVNIRRSQGQVAYTHRVMLLERLHYVLSTHIWPTTPNTSACFQRSSGCTKAAKCLAFFTWKLTIGW